MMLGFVPQPNLQRYDIPAFLENKKGETQHNGRSQNQPPKAFYIETYILAEKIIDYGTIDVPLDPEEQSEYRANREIVEDHGAFIKMKEDAKESRTFSNLVAEFTKDYGLCGTYISL